MKYSIVITTVYLPTVLESLSKNIADYGHKNEAEVIVIGDLKTPPETSDYINRFKKQGFNFEYWDIKKQRSWLKRFPELEKIIPYNSDNRRNIGYLIAYENFAECIIVLDDDNYPFEDIDFLASHSVFKKKQLFQKVTSSTNWLNICDYLEFDESTRIYPRGFPYKFRTQKKNEILNYEHVSGRIVLNEGLWIGEPDVDAITRISLPVQSLKLKSKEKIVLAQGTSSPINTQNTSIHRDIIPSFYYIAMHENIDGFEIDRYGDIWSGYFAKKIIDHMGDYISFGEPLVMHKRHEHNLFLDLRKEYYGMVLTEYLVDILARIKLTKSDYYSCSIELADKLEEAFTELEGEHINEKIKQYLYSICNNIRTWVNVCENISLSKVK